MRNNQASREQAVALIRRAVADGWKREVSANTLPGRLTPYVVHVSLSYLIPEFFDHGMVIIAFRRAFESSHRKTRSSVAITSYRFSNGKARHGLWDANYTINEINRSAKHLAEIQATRKADEQAQLGEA
jgi:hypothetical protein